MDQNMNYLYQSHFFVFCRVSACQVNEMTLVDCRLGFMFQIFIFTGWHKDIWVTAFIRVLQLKLYKRIEIKCTQKMHLFLLLRNLHKDYNLVLILCFIKLQQIIVSLRKFTHIFCCKVDFKFICCDTPCILKNILVCQVLVLFCIQIKP